MERGSAWQSSLKGRERVIAKQMSIGNVSKAPLEIDPRDVVELM